MTILKRKRFTIRNLRLSEISSVDQPAQTGAVAILMKRADDRLEQFDTILKSAKEVEEGGQPIWAVEDYEGAMLYRAKHLAGQSGQTPEQALATGLRTDGATRALARASEIARVVEHAALIKSRYGSAG